MLRAKIQFGLSYAIVGALILCAVFPSLGLVAWHSVLPTLIILGLGGVGVGIMNRLQVQSRENRSRETKINLTEDARSYALLGHEIKNYLCTLKGNARLLRQRSGAPEHDPILDRIDRVVAKLEVFAKDLGHSPEPKVSLPNPKPSIRKPVRLGEVARTCVQTHFYGQADSFQWHTPHHEPSFLGDSNRLEQIFLNLYVNAKEAGALKIETTIRREGNRLSVTVEDDGIGCHPADLPRLFEPFYTTKSGPARRGLGMFVVQSIVESHGGKMSAHSKNGSFDNAHGLIFTLDFPLPLPSLASVSKFSSRPKVTTGIRTQRLVIPPLF